MGKPGAYLTVGRRAHALRPVYLQHLPAKLRQRLPLTLRPRGDAQQPLLNAAAQLHAGVSRFHQKREIDQHAGVVAALRLPRMYGATRQKHHIPRMQLIAYIVEPEAKAPAAHMQNFMLRVPVHIHVVADVCGRDIVNGNRQPLVPVYNLFPVIHRNAP